MTAYYNEIEKYPARWIENLIAAGHIAPGVVDQRDIREVMPDDIEATQAHFFAGIGVWSYALRLAGWPDDRPVWTGSCPCQPFSTAGKRGGTNDSRHLWPEWFRLIRERRPPVIFGEQVASKDGLAWLDLVYDDLESAGYSVAAFDLCAAGVGAPHIRQRLYFVANSDRDNNTTERSRKESGISIEHREEESCAGKSGGTSNSLCAVADAESARWRIWNADDIWKADREIDPFSDNNKTYNLGNSGGAGLALDPGQRGNSRQEQPPIIGASWSDLEWLPCRDGKARPTQPGLFPLAHGATARVGRLRAYGNAIVAPLAAEFIRAYMDTE